MISAMHGAAEGGSEGAFPVIGEEVQFAKMTEAEKGKEGRKERKGLSHRAAISDVWW